MLTKEENDLLCRVENKAPMGELMKRHWIPVCMSEEVAEPDGAPVRLRILGEELVAFRNSEGKLGVMDGHCPHRGALLRQRLVRAAGGSHTTEGDPRARELRARGGVGAGRRATHRRPAFEPGLQRNFLCGLSLSAADRPAHGVTIFRRLCAAALLLYLQSAE